MHKLYLTTLYLLFAFTAFSQSVVLEGYVFEEGNRGYLNTARILVEEAATGDPVGETFSNTDGFFTMDVQANTKYTIHVSKDFFQHVDVNVTTTGDSKSFVKVEMEREPGYMFEITLADKKSEDNTITDGIRNTRIEVYNNTTQKSELLIEDHPEPEFRVRLNKGNHYTILIRKNGYFSKKMEAFVNVNDCILCFEGVGSVGPGVADNLTAGNNYGVLLANVEMDKVFEGKSLAIENLYYDTDKSFLREDAKGELDKVVTMLKYNPRLTVELGSHTDSRASDEYNMDLSDRRAKSAVDYLKREGGINTGRISSRGYGESVLVNKCADGVSCSEEQHQKNRRTELKIVGIDEGREFIPLTELKKREELEALAVSGQLGEEVSGDELNRILSAEELEEVPNQDANDSEVEQSKNKAIVKNQKISENANEVKNSTLSDASHMKPKVLHGPRIVLLVADDRITTDHEIYNQHEDIEAFELPTGKMWYMIGGYDDKEAAQADLNKYESPDHPNPFVVEFNNGKVISN